MIHYPRSVKADIPAGFDCSSSTRLLDWLVKAELGLPDRFLICSKKRTTSSNDGWIIEYMPGLVIVDSGPIPKAHRFQKNGERLGGRKHPPARLRESTVMRLGEMLCYHRHRHPLITLSYRIRTSLLALGRREIPGGLNRC